MRHETEVQCICTIHCAGKEQKGVSGNGTPHVSCTIPRNLIAFRECTS